MKKPNLEGRAYMDGYNAGFAFAQTREKSTTRRLLTEMLAKRAYIKGWKTGLKRARNIIAEED